MRKTKAFLAAAVSAAMTLTPVAAYAEAETSEAAAEETEEGIEEGIEDGIEEAEPEEKSGWLSRLQGLLDEGGEAISGVFGKGGVIENALPDQEEVDQAVSEIKEGLGEIGSGVMNGVDELGAGLTEGLGEIGSGLGGLLGLVGGLLGGGSGGLEEFFALSEKMKEAGKAYMLEENAKVMEDGDVQILIDGPVTDSVTMDGIGEDGIVYTITLFTQQNFTEDEEHTLHLLCEKQDLVFLELHETEDAGMAVAAAEFIEEGDGLAERLEKYMPLMYSDSVEECIESITFVRLYDLPETLAGYLDEHPEYTGIEYQGEIMTAEELRTVRDEQTWSYYGVNVDELEEESETAEEAQ